MTHAFEIPSSVQSLSHVQLRDHMDCSTPGLPVHHQLLEFTQTHVHWVGDATQPSHPLLSASPPAFSLSLASGSFLFFFFKVSLFCFKFYIIVLVLSQLFIFRWPKYWSFSFSIRPYSGLHIQDWFPLGWTGWISFLSKRLSRDFSNTAVQKYPFFTAQLSLESNSHIHTWPLEKP